MNKRYLHHLLKQLQKLNTLYLTIAVIVAAASFVLAYRHNNVQALHLRDNLLAVDKAGGDIEPPLRALRSYTYSHMNADLNGGPGSVYPPIQLIYRYGRLVNAEKARVAAVNAPIYTAAQNYCESQLPGGRVIDRVPCVDSYIASHPVAQAQSIPDALYKFDFVSPAWSPDVAGWSLLLTVLLSVVLIVRLSLAYWLRRSLQA